MSRHKENFYGLTLDPEQREFVSAILDPTAISVFCNAKAGTGKTTLAVGAANMLYHKKRCDGIIYLFSPVQESKQGFLPGTPEEKSRPYYTPLTDAMDALGIDSKCFDQLYRVNGGNSKQFKPYISAFPHTYLRGANLLNKAIIVDECQNFDHEELKKTLTRLHDSCKIICIGHIGQTDISKAKSGFAAFLSSAEEQPFIRTCTLSKNYRGVFSQWADSV